MTEHQAKDLKKLTDRYSEATAAWEEYWRDHSYYDTWQFWVLLALLILPLVVLIFRLDREKAFRLGFYGFAVHVLAIYIDLYATTHDWWAYPFKVFPFPPSSFSLDASLIPVSYMLVYQWTLHRKKNYYVYMGLLAAAFSFALKPLFVALNLFELHEATYLTLFVAYLAGGLGSKWIVDLFAFAERRARAKG